MIEKIKGQIITIDAMGTQTEIVKKIHQKGADYVLAVKKNQQALHEEVSAYMENQDFQGTR